MKKSSSAPVAKKAPVSSTETTKRLHRDRVFVGLDLWSTPSVLRVFAYYARAAAANTDDLRLIKSCTDLAVECALRRESGVIGHDEDKGGILRAIEFPGINGGRPFDIETPWFGELLTAIAQPKGTKQTAKH